MEDIYYVEIPNNKCFKGVYVNKKVILENEVIDDEISSMKTEVDEIINEIKNLNISKEFKIYLLKSEFEIFRLKNELKDLKKDFKQLKCDLLGAKDDIEEDIDEDIDEDKF